MNETKKIKNKEQERIKLKNKHKKTKKQKINTQNKLILNLGLFIFLAIIIAPNTFAALVLDNIQYDPAIISAGDEIDIIIQFHDEQFASENSKITDEQYSFEVKLETDDTLGEKYIIIQDSKGDTLQGGIKSGLKFTKLFRVKVLNNAPASNYQLKLTGQWYKNGKAQDISQQSKFFMNVKKEGIILDISTLETNPAEIRPGDKFVKIISRIENAGSKDAKSAEIKLKLPEGISSSYSNNNRIWIGRVNAGESKEMTFFINLDEKLKNSVYTLEEEINYLDLDNNKYTKKINTQVLVKTKPNIEIIKSEGFGLRGSTGQLKITVKNTGSESAESVDLRILKQNSQAFNLDVRSDYIGELKPGEIGQAIFEIETLRDAKLKTHDFKVLIRAKGDTDEGNDNIYQFNRRAKYVVNGDAPNKLKNYGLFGAITLLILFAIHQIQKRRK